MRSETVQVVGAALDHREPLLQEPGPAILNSPCPHPPCTPGLLL